MTDPRLQWLLDRLAEDEATAKAATPGPWYWQGDILDENNSTVIDVEVVRAVDVEHVVTWDPARALAVVAALRQILEEHAPWHPQLAAYPDHMECDRCYYAGDAQWPCPTVRAIASIWADRPGYAEVWGDE